jgi:hypothetical protein
MRKDRPMKAKKFKPTALSDALVLGLGAIFESMPRSAREEAATLVRHSIRAGLADDPQAERLLRGIFLLDRELA